MKRHEALIPLTHDHHHALAQARRLHSAAEGTDGDRLTGSRDFLAFFDDDTIRHFREEEEVLFPLAVDSADARIILERAMWDHLQIHHLVAVLAAGVRKRIPTPDAMVRVASSLQSHIRYEEKVVFPMIESIVDDADLGSMDLGLRVRADHYEGHSRIRSKA